MDLPKLKIALKHASKVDTLRQQKKKANEAAGGDKEDIPAFAIDVDAVYAAAAALWSVDSVTVTGSPGSWPAKATAAIDVSTLLRTDRSFECNSDIEGGSNDDQCLEYYLQDEDGVLKVLVEAGLAQRFVELLLVPHNAAPALLPPELEDKFEFDSSLTLTTSTAVQFYVCQAIYYMLDFTRWAFCESLLKAKILAPLNTIITTSGHPDLCSSAVRVVALLGSWEFVQFSPDMHQLQPHSKPICALLLSALTNSASAVCIGLEKSKSPAWIHGSASSSSDEYKYLDMGVGPAIDTLKDNFPMCGPDVQQAVLKAVSQVIKAGALSEQFLSLKAAVGFLGRHYLIEGVEQGPQMPRPVCPRLESSAVVTEVALACASMTWSGEGTNCRSSGPSIFSALFQQNQSMWTAEILGQGITSCMIQPSAEWPEFLSQKVSPEWFTDLVEQTPDSLFEVEDLVEPVGCMYNIISPYLSRPWEPPPETEEGEESEDAWKGSKECLSLETVVMLAALEAGALRFSIRANTCGAMNDYTNGMFEHLTGSNSDGHKVLTRLRACKKSWPLAMPHLVEAAQQLVDIAFAQLVGNQDPEEGEGEEPDESPADPEEDGGEEGDAEGEAEEIFTNPWREYKVFTAVKFLAEVSALHQRELAEFDPKKPDPGAAATVSGGAVFQPAFASKHAMLQALRSSIQKVVDHIVKVMEDEGQEAAVYAAPLIVALLGQFLDSDDPLSFNADLLLKSGAISKICLYIKSIPDTPEDDETFFDLMVVLSVLARRNPEARTKLMGLKVLPLLLKRATDDPQGSWSVVEMVGFMVCSDEVHGPMKQASAPKVLMQVLKDSSIDEDHIFGALGALAQLCASGLTAEDKEVQKLLESKKFCSLAVTKFNKCVPTGDGEYGQGLAELVNISYVLLHLCGNTAFAENLVSKLGLCTAVVKVMKALRQEQTEPVLIAIKILLSVVQHKELLQLVKDAKAGVTIKTFTTHHDPRIKEAALSCLAQLGEAAPAPTAIAVKPVQPQPAKATAAAVTAQPVKTAAADVPVQPLKAVAVAVQPLKAPKEPAVKAATGEVVLSVMAEDLRSSRAEVADLKAFILQALKTSAGDVKAVQDELKLVKETCAQLLLGQAGNASVMSARKDTVPVPAAAPVRTSPQKTAALAPTKAPTSPVGSAPSSPRVAPPALTADPPALTLKAAAATVTPAAGTSPLKPNTPRTSPAIKPTSGAVTPVVKAGG